MSFRRRKELATTVLLHFCCYAMFASVVMSSSMSNLAGEAVYTHEPSMRSCPNPGISRMLVASSPC